MILQIIGLFAVVNIAVVSIGIPTMYAFGYRIGDKRKRL